MADCKYCGRLLVKRDNEDPYRFKGRLYCNRQCSDPGRNPMTLDDAIRRFESFVSPEPNSGCWLWTGTTTRGGYATLSYMKRPRRAARLSVAFFKGIDIPAGLIVRHKCDMPLCVNPDHLILGTHKDNMRDAIERKRIRVGERNPGAKVTTSQALEIIKAPGKYRDIGAKYGISASGVCLIKKGVNWRHLRAGECEMFEPARVAPQEKAA